MREKKEMILFVCKMCIPGGDFDSIDKRHDLQIELKRLSVRDLEILSCKAGGMNNKKTAETLKIWPETVGVRLQRIKKLLKIF